MILASTDNRQNRQTDGQTGRQILLRRFVIAVSFVMAAIVFFLTPDVADHGQTYDLCDSFAPQPAASVAAGAEPIRGATTPATHR